MIPRRNKGSSQTKILFHSNAGFKLEPEYVALGIVLMLTPSVVFGLVNELENTFFNFRKRFFTYK